MKTVVLVPRRADNGRRDQIWHWVLSRWLAEHDWPVHEGEHNDGPFNRSAAINDAARSAGDWDVAVIADSDSFVGPDQVRSAVEGAYDNGNIWLAYDRFMYLTRQMSEAIMGGFTGMWENGVEWSMTGTCSSMVVVRRDLWETVGGFDEGFVGWCGEDVGFSVSCQSLGNGLNRVPGPVWHLFHQPSPENSNTPEYRANLARMKRYGDCDFNPEKIRSLLVDLGVKKPEHKGPGGALTPPAMDHTYREVQSCGTLGPPSSGSRTSTKSTPKQGAGSGPER